VRGRFPRKLKERLRSRSAVILTEGGKSTYVTLLATMDLLRLGMAF
jgi:hypothetical protein